MARPPRPAPRPDLTTPEPPDVPELVAELRRWRQDLTSQMAYFQRMDSWFRDLQERLGYPDPGYRPVIHGPGFDSLESRLHAVETVLAQLTRNVAHLTSAHELLTTGVADGAASAQVEAVRLHAHLDELMTAAEGARLESHGSVVQLHEVVRRLLADVRAQPELVANLIVARAPAATGDLSAVYVVPAPATGETILLVGPAEEDLAA